VKVSRKAFAARYVRPGFVELTRVGAREMVVTASLQTATSREYTAEDYVDALQTLAPIRAAAAKRERKRRGVE
jgi:hypothetical protein